MTDNRPSNELTPWQREQITHTDWVCHARPAALNGATCGHHNTGAPFRHGPFGVECCRKCGCTKIASDSREKANG